MGIIGYNKLRICSNCTIYEFIIIPIYLNKIKMNI